MSKYFVDSGKENSFLTERNLKQNLVQGEAAWFGMRGGNMINLTRTPSRS